MTIGDNACAAERGYAAWLFLYEISLLLDVQHEQPVASFVCCHSCAISSPVLSRYSLDFAIYAFSFLLDH